MSETTLAFPERVAQLNASYARTFIDSVYFLQRQTVAMWRTALDSLDEAAAHQRTALLKPHPQRSPARPQTAERIVEAPKAPTVTRGHQDLAISVAEAAQIESERASHALAVILDAITAALVAGDEVRLPQFGIFKVIPTKARIARNPRTGEPVAVPAGTKPVFRASSALRKRVE